MTATATRLGQLRADVSYVLRRSTLRPQVLRLIDGAALDLADPPPAASSSLYELVNQARATVGAAAVVRDAEAERLAQAWAEEMARTDDFRHNPSLAAQLSAPWFSCGENIAYGYADEAAVHQGWMDSPPHRRNVEGPAFTGLGVGQAAGAAGRRYWVEVFVDRTR